MRVATPFTSEAYPCPRCANTDVGVHARRQIPGIDTDEIATVKDYDAEFVYSIGCKNPKCRYVGMQGRTVSEAICIWNRHRTWDKGPVEKDPYNIVILKMCRWLQGQLKIDEHVAYTRINGSAICPGAHKVSVIRKTETAVDEILSWTVADPWIEDCFRYEHHRREAIAALWLQLGKLRGIEEATE